MTHDEAKQILEQIDSQPPKFSRSMESVVLAGEYTIEQLQAILQLMEYNA